MSSESTAPAATKLITINDDDYRSTVTLQNLKKPDFKILLERLQNHADWKGLFPNDTAIDEWKDLKFWDPFISSTIEIIQECVANRDISKAKIRSLQRDLVQKEETLIENFSRENTSKIDPNHRRLAVLQMICRTLMDLLKEDMCKGVTNKISEVNIIIENAFTSSDTDVASLFPSERLLQSIYYVAGWHLGTVLKASTRRAGKMATIMKKFHFANFLSEDEAKKEKLPTDYVSGTQLFGGLNFVREKYFSFILRVEYIFVKCLTPEKLAIFGNEIMQILYSKLNASSTLRKEIIMLFDDDEIDNEENEDDISSFIRFLFRSYCRMRGKDYCRNIMSTSS